MEFAGLFPAPLQERSAVPGVEQHIEKGLREALCRQAIAVNHWPIPIFRGGWEDEGLRLRMDALPLEPNQIASLKEEYLLKSLLAEEPS